MPLCSVRDAIYDQSQLSTNRIFPTLSRLEFKIKLTIKSATAMVQNPANISFYAQPMPCYSKFLRKTSKHVNLKITSLNCCISLCVLMFIRFVTFRYMWCRCSTRIYKTQAALYIFFCILVCILYICISYIMSVVYIYVYIYIAIWVLILGLCISIHIQTIKNNKSLLLKSGT